MTPPTRTASMPRASAASVPGDGPDGAGAAPRPARNSDMGMPVWAGGGGGGGGGCAVGTGCAVGLGVGLGLGVPLLAGLAYAATRRGQYGYGRTRAMLSGNAASFNDDRGQAQPSFSTAPVPVPGGDPKATPAPSGYEDFGPGSLRTSHNAL